MREELDLPKQADRLFDCTLRFEDWVSPITRASMVGWDNAEADPWRGILPRRDAWVRLCMHRLGALRHSAFALDVYLWDAWHGAPGAPAPARLEVYRALAEASVSPPREDALAAFEGELHAVREHIARLAGEVSATAPGLVYALPGRPGCESAPEPASGRCPASPVSRA